MTDDFEDELESRLSAIEHPTYADPARADLPARDLLLLVIVGSLVIALMWWWGYPG